MYSTKGVFVQQCVAEVLADGKPHKYREIFDYTKEKAIGTEFEGGIEVNNMVILMQPCIKDGADYMRVRHGVYQLRSAVPPEQQPVTASENEMYSMYDKAEELKVHVDKIYQEACESDAKLAERLAPSHKMITEHLDKVMDGMSFWFADYEDYASEKFETAQKEDDDGVLTETYKVKTPEYIEFGDPWYKDFEPERVAQLMVNTFPRPTDACRVVLTAEPSEHYAGMYDCTMSIFIAPTAHIETYMQGCVYEGQQVNDRRIGVDTAKYLIDVDGSFDEIHTGADGHWGNHLKIGRNIGGKEITDCEIIRIYMPEEETMDSMRQKFCYFFSDAQQIDNVKERFLEDIDGGDNSEDISDTQEPKMN